MKNLAVIWILLLALISTSAVANTDVAFAYQGRVRVQGSPFEGEGQFKFAIVSTSGDTVLWTHDGTGFDNGIPSGYITLPVEDGIFNAIIGDTATGMTPINSTIFNSPTPLKLRVWFNNGFLGFQQLNPDYNLVNLTLNTLKSSEQDFTIYVDGVNGNDTNNGLTTARAKKTIQAAIDTLPERLRCNVTVDIADGVYRESVNIFGLSVEPGKALKLQGDTAWNGTGSPAVRLTGLSENNIPLTERHYGIVARQCSGLIINGIATDNFAKAGIHIENGIFEVANCKSTHNRVGLQASDCNTTCTNVTVSNCATEGFLCVSQASVRLRNCSSLFNGISGLTINDGSAVNLQGTGNYSNNNEYGYRVQHHSRVIFSLAFPQYVGTVANNKKFGMSLTYQSYSENHTVNNFTGNGNSNLIEKLYGGITTY